MASQFSIKLRTLAKGFTKLSKQTCSEAVDLMVVVIADEETEGKIVKNEEGEGEGEVKEGVASIVLLPCGSISGHFIHMPLSICYGLHGTELACETECSRGEDYRLMKLTIIDYNVTKFIAFQRQQADELNIKTYLVCESFRCDRASRRKSVSFECETLKADQAAEDHVRQFMPKLAGLDAVSTYKPNCSFFWHLITLWFLALFLISTI
ncbi:hypothetical protein F2Q68_00011835 [Brassica cretica]|uniref:Uncharacterized protein n=1 Tax=Brassica cretica TaxID=69181 RepID=A0A8S9KWZ8_BRACR|nr:hypothetical protein F2Q68_00011835 [Brassica cretica]